MNNEIKETIKLLLKSSDYCPYRGKLSEEETLVNAIELAKYILEFAVNGQTDEAMDLSVEHLEEVISELEKM